MGPATLNHLRNTATLHTNGQLVTVPRVHLLSEQVCLQLELQQSNIRTSLMSPFKNGWDILCHQQIGGGGHRIIPSHQWKLTSLLPLTLCSTWFHAGAKLMDVVVLLWGRVSAVGTTARWSRKSARPIVRNSDRTSPENSGEYGSLVLHREASIFPPRGTGLFAKSQNT